MRKMTSCVLFCLVVSSVFWCISAFHDQAYLSSELIRMHVVANSDTPVDQELKLKVRDAICESIEKDLQSIQNMDLAKQYLQENLPKLEKAANSILQQAGVDMTAVVTMCKEMFPMRMYDTFRLPAGIYETLKVTIGEGDGQNWWCVAFPALCIQPTVADFEAAAVSAGFSPTLTKSLTYDSEYEIRFYLMDMAGKIKGLLFP